MQTSPRLCDMTTQEGSCDGIITPYSSEAARRFGEYITSIIRVEKYVKLVVACLRLFLLGLHIDPEGDTFLRNVGLCELHEL
jgi:hypothetical protein